MTHIETAQEDANRSHVSITIGKLRHTHGQHVLPLNSWWLAPLVGGGYFSRAAIVDLVQPPSMTALPLLPQAHIDAVVNASCGLFCGLQYTWDVS